MQHQGSKDYQAKQRGNHLTDVEKRSIVRQVEQGVLTPHAARKAYGLSGNTLNKWLKASVKENVELAAYDPFEMKDKPVGQSDLPDPEKEALKKALEDAQLKISALNTLIDVAEDQFKIKIRKKAGARQS
jgi:transposase